MYRGQNIDPFPIKGMVLNPFTYFFILLHQLRLDSHCGIDDIKLPLLFGFTLWYRRPYLINTIVLNMLHASFFMFDGE